MLLDVADARVLSTAEINDQTTKSKSMRATLGACVSAMSCAVRLDGHTKINSVKAAAGREKLRCVSLFDLDYPRIGVSIALDILSIYGERAVPGSISKV